MVAGRKSCARRGAAGLNRTHPHMQVSQWNVADDVVEDFDAGLEYGKAESILRSVQKGDAREYLVRWGSAHTLDRRATAGSMHM